MPQDSLRDEDIKGLNEENKILAEVIKKKEEDRIFFENKNKELLYKNEKMADKVLGKLLVQGDKHFTLDMIITKDIKISPYLNFIKDKEVVISVEK